MKISKLRKLKSINVDYKTIFLLLLIMIFATLIYSYNSTYAETTSKANVSVEVLPSCTVTTNNNEHSGTISNGTYNEISDPTEFNIVCNSNNKYDIYAIGYTGDTEGNNKLIGDKDSENKYNIVTGVNQSGEESNWAFMLSDLSGGLILEPDYSKDFAAIPGQSERVAYREASTVSNINDSFKSHYAAYISKSQPADTYHGKVKYTLIDQGPTPIINYSINYDINGGDESSLPDENPQSGQTTNPDDYIVLSDVEPTNYGVEFLGWCTEMPDEYNDNDCPGSTYWPGDEYYLTEGTNVTLYAIWNLEYLGDLGEMQSFTCDQIDNIHAYGEVTDIRDNNTYTVAKLKDEQCWMTQNLRLGDDNLENRILTQYNTDLEIGTNYDLPQSKNRGFSDPSTAYVYVDTSNENYGGYYSYPAATAGTNPSSGNAPSSICPAGWRLPNYDDLDSLTSFYTHETIQNAPANLVLSGQYLSSRLQQPGRRGAWWSSTAEELNDTGAYRLLLMKSGSKTFEVALNSKSIGSSIRCVCW